MIWTNQGKGCPLSGPVVPVLIIPSEAFPLSLIGYRPWASACHWRRWSGGLMGGDQIGNEIDLGKLLMLKIKKHW